MMSMKARCSSSSTLSEPLGERLGLPSGVTVATKQSLRCATMRFMSSVSTAMPVASAVAEEDLDIDLETPSRVLVRDELLVDELDVLEAARLLEQKIALRRQQREILDRENDRLPLAVVDVLVIGPRRTEERVALLPFDLGRLGIALVLHHVEAGSLQDVIDRERG